MQFIILTRKSDGKAVYVNPKQICFITADSECGTLIQFCGNDENYIQVLESLETIAGLCEGSDGI
jgi:hypothetical protein